MLGKKNQCPMCKSNNTRKMGITLTKDGYNEYRKCVKCGYRWKFERKDNENNA